MHSLQEKIIKALGVTPTFHLEEEIHGRLHFLKEQLKRTHLHAYVLGLSGGIDSTVAGRLAQLAVEALRHEGYEARFIAMRLPYDRQHDEHHALAACQFVNPDELLTVNIKKTSDSLLHELKAASLTFRDEKQQDFILGNIKARQRMVAQYAVAGARGALVIGTDHAAEALMGFFTKFGDGACDLTPLAGLTKRRIRAIGGYLGAPIDLIDKCPTADLECLRPLHPDEDAFGVTYHEIDDFLEGKTVEDRVSQIICQQFAATAHKRALPIHPSDEPFIPIEK